MFKKFLQETDSEAEWFELFVCSGECFNLRQKINSV